MDEMVYKYDFNHLVLLVGTNPLPNFVVADYFLQRNPDIEKIWLIHSEKNKFQAATNEQADNLEEILKDRWLSKYPKLFPFEKIAISDVSNAKIIRNDICQKMFDNLKVNKGIHFNYTGGTKSMSIHVYWMLRELENSETEFSYLDARNFRLISDKAGVIEVDLRKNITFSFDEMVRLHGFKRNNKPSDFVFSNALKVLQKLIETDQLDKYYGNGGYHRECFLDDRENLSKTIKKLSESSGKKLNEFKPNQTLMSIISKMPEEYQLFDSEDKFNDQLQNKKFKAAVKFLDGDWLERFVFESIESLKEEKNITIEQTWVIDKPDWPPNLDFELDVVLINGYQLTGISCTTDTGKYCKNKGFEMIHRTRQIGGDEAKAVLITRMNENDRDNVQQELEIHTGGNRTNILVLGETDLKKETLACKISQFVLNEA